ncbi:MAG TPA: hypothetical protein DIU35_16975 [Candidatus Latescibacteria bacterium]|nr:hypothetical protein [Gemmatimonadota bacterium]HCR19174.1 hypothetical protein [Candidatus Latescibacterota bacterium]
MAARFNDSRNWLRSDATIGREQILRPTAEGLVYIVLSRRYDVIGTLVLLMFLSLLQVHCRAAVGDI